ncbi:MAG: DsrE family protein [Flavobacteriales bacterium]
MKKLIPFILGLMLVINSFGQSEAPHKVVMQVTANDTLVYKALLNNIFHLKEGFGDSLKIEVVLHGPAVMMAVANKTKYSDQIKKWSAEGVDFMVCENTMKKKNITHEEIVPGAKFVPMGLGEIILKEEEGWSYVKIGF